eukprot:m.354555 g.354555  ORF g.354555 m.354555 type:complete len:530 (+) comp17053_c0_seq1:416-2005(+)
MMMSIHDAIASAIPETMQPVVDKVHNVVEAVHSALGSPSTTKLLVGAAVSIGTFKYIKGNFLRPANAPPRVVSKIPWLGYAAVFGQRPIDFLLECTEKYGPVFSFTMFGTEVTYLLGSEASAKFWSTENSELNAEDLYANITTPVFGEGIAYAVPHSVFSEQKQMAKEGLTRQRFAAYTSRIEEETNDYISRWGKQGTFVFFSEMAKMIILTATNCLHGDETRRNFDTDTAKLYEHLDGGFSPLAWFFPYWVPFPSFRRRDAAHKKLKTKFGRVVALRRQSGNVQAGRTDLMETFMTTPYRKVLNGRNMTDSEVSGMLIALLMAGQHTSSTVSSWMMSFICATPGLQEKLYEEQVAAFEKLPGPITMEHLDYMPLLHACVRETLRLRPPIMTIMRKARVDFEVTVKGKTYVIPKGSQVCVSPTVNQRLPSEWDEPMKFDPNRFLKKKEDGTLVVTQGEQIKKGGRFKWVPFGAGRHRCIGFEFAQLQIRCVMSTLLRKYKFDLKGSLEVNYASMIHTPLDSTMEYTVRA